MHKILLLTIALLGYFNCFSQESNPISEKYTAHNKGKIYIFWGGNRDSYTKSDIHFKGNTYDFTLHDVAAVDKPKGWHVDYLNPSRMTIPQTNFRIGYFINDHYNVSIGLDHMKYVMVQNQSVQITGNYPAIFDGTVITNGNVDLSDTSFLTFEHTDGLNYINSEISRVDDISKIFKIRNTDKFQISLTEGVGGGILYPKTNVMLMGQPRHDDFNVAGYGVSAKAGLNLTFFKYFFIQAELKGGYINMPNIKTTFDNADSASQHFMFFQRIIAFGGIFKI
jgi:hypothetical protein